MDGEYDGFASFCLVLQGLYHTVCHERVQARGRLITKQQSRVGQQLIIYIEVTMHVCKLHIYKVHPFKVNSCTVEAERLDI